jgi:hypothetical protein
MKKFAKSLMLTLTALCLSVCFLFAGCSKQAGTYVGVTLLSQKSVELKLSGNDEFELTVGDSSTKGTWAVDEENENVVILTFDGIPSTATATIEEKVLVIAYVGTNSTMTSAVGAKLTKK